MTPLPNVASVLKIALKYNDGVAEFGSRLFEHYDGAAPDNAALNSYAALVAGAWTTHLAPRTCTSMSLIEVVVQDITSPTYANGTWSGDVAGALSSQAVPSNVTFDVEFRIGIRYRGGHPVIHLPGQPTSYLANSRTWGETDADLVTTAFADFATEISDTSISPLETMEHSVVRGYRNPPPIGFPTVEPVDSYAPRYTVGTARRRVRPLR
jgi:hypothetical protein